MNRRTDDSPSAPEAGVTPEAQPSGLVAAGEHSAGFVGYDDLGRSRWSWVNELDPTSRETDADDVLKALDTNALSLAEESGAAPPVRRPAKEKGYDPYDTGRIKVGDLFRRR